MRLVNVWHPASTPFSCLQGSFQLSRQCTFSMASPWNNHSVVIRPMSSAVLAQSWYSVATMTCPAAGTERLLVHGAECLPTSTARALDQPGREGSRDAGVKLFLDCSLWRQWPFILVWWGPATAASGHHSWGSSTAGPLQMLAVHACPQPPAARGASCSSVCSSGQQVLCLVSERPKEPGPFYFLGGGG